MTQATIDQTTFNELKATAGADFVSELVGDADRFRRAAHSLKSNSNTFGALTLGALAKNLELTGIAPAAAAKGATLDSLDAEYARVAAALKELARG